MTVRIARTGRNAQTRNKKANKDLVIYISMPSATLRRTLGPEIVQDTLDAEKTFVSTVSLATRQAPATPTAYPQRLSQKTRRRRRTRSPPPLPPDTAEEKINAAYAAGCRRFDSALTGLGGCPSP